MKKFLSIVFLMIFVSSYAHTNSTVDNVEKTFVTEYSDISISSTIFETAPEVAVLDVDVYEHLRIVIIDDTSFINCYNITKCPLLEYYTGYSNSTNKQYKSTIYLRSSFKEELSYLETLENKLAEYHFIRFYPIDHYKYSKKEKSHLLPLLNSTAILTLGITANGSNTPFHSSKPYGINKENSLSNIG